jgi:penicillin-binding protein 2
MLCSKNRASQGVYPPGSIFKIVTMAAALDRLGLAADTSFFCTGTWDRLGDQSIKMCWLKTGRGQDNASNADPIEA